MAQDQQFNFQDTAATQKIFSLKKRIRAIAGGTSASKTISILVWLIDYCQTKKNVNKLCTVTSESFPHLKGGAMRDFIAIMKDRGYWNEARWNKSDHIYTFETGNLLEFVTMNDYGKAHGPRRHVLFVNECNNLAYEIVDQMITRTAEVVFLDWNPSEEFWFYTEMLPNRTDIDFLTLTYKDNGALSKTIIDEIESHKNNLAWWTVYGEGKLGQLSSRIYTNWEFIDAVPPEARLERYGLDFGYSIDPTVIEAIYRYQEGFVIDEETYQKGLSNRSISDILNNLMPALVIADSSEPKSIDEIKGYGINIIGAMKGPGSVNTGIQFVKAQKIYITRRSIKTIKGYRNYLWTTDKDGHSVNVPDDTIHEWSNPMDAVRYGLDSFRPRKQTPRPQTDFGGVKPFIPGMFA